MAGLCRHSKGMNTTATKATIRTHLGRLGEEIATRYLQEQGWEILERNYRGRNFELDLIAHKGALTAVVEVRTRRTCTPTHIAETITATKYASLRRGAAHWLAQQGADTELRFDLVAVAVCGNRAQVLHYPGVK